MLDRNELFNIVKELDPVGLHNRTQRLDRRRGDYIVPGPDFCWSVDGYCKLEVYGIQIYAGIDAYSRCVIWIYVGVSARTMVSVLKQLATTVRKRKLVPHLIRSDMGKETIMAADFQYQHACKVRQTEENEDCAFNTTWIYGTSTLNQRIESWWQQISRARLHSWRVSLFSSSLSLDPIFS
jgi:hypothetical protein